MNLKTAARRLGVHYQTAYRWVRSGQLVAVKVGSGYEVSEAALARFQAQRAATERVPDPIGPAPAAAGAGAAGGDPRELLDRMVDAVVVDASAVYTRAARLVAETIGDIGVVSLLDDDGRARPVAFDHADPVCAVRTGAALHWGLVDAPSMSDATIASRDAVLVPQVPQRGVRPRLRPEFHQYLAERGFFSGAAAPICIDGEVRGSVFVERDVPGRPLGADDLGLLREVAARVGLAHERAGRAREAWAVRSMLVERLGGAGAAEATAQPCSTWTDEWLSSAVGDNGVGAAILDLELRHVALTKHYALLLGAEVGQLHGAAVAPRVRPADRLRDALARVLFGELDFCQVAVAPVADAPVLELMMHAAIIRLPDATPRCLVVVAHALPELADA